MESEEWKKERAANAWIAEYLASFATREFLEREHADVRAFLLDLGLAK